MRRTYQATALLFLTLAIFVMWQAQRLKYWVLTGPGPGFFPFWLGAAFAVLSLAWLAQVSLRPTDPMARGLVPDRAGAIRLALALTALVLFILLADVIGFRLAMSGLLFFLIFRLGRQNAILALAVALAGAFGVFYLFDQHLKVHLPSASIETLRTLGL